MDRLDATTVYDRRKAAARRHWPTRQPLPAATSLEGRAPATRRGPKGLRRTTGRNQPELSRQINRSAKDGARSSPHYGAKAFGFHSVAPRCVRATRWGRCVNDLGRPNIVQRKGMAGVRHLSTGRGISPFWGAQNSPLWRGW